METMTRRKEHVKPVTGRCRWMILPIRIRDFASGILDIDGTEYAVTMPANLCGARLRKPGGTVYHVDLEKHVCDCPDFVFRGRECKHHKALTAALTVFRGKEGQPA